MLDKEIYEVERDEFTGFKDQLKMSCIQSEIKNEEDKQVENFYSITTGALLCARECDRDTGDFKYYVYNMPEDDERKPAPRKRLIELQTREEAQKFFDYITLLLKKHD